MKLWTGVYTTLDRVSGVCQVKGWSLGQRIGGSALEWVASRSAEVGGSYFIANLLGLSDVLGLDELA